MKILYIPLDTAIPEEDDFYLALKKAGHEVTWYWDHHFIDCHEYDIAHFQSGAVKRDIISACKVGKCLVTQWTGDYRPEPMEMVTQYEGLVDITYMAADVPELYPRENIKWLPHGVGDRNFRPINPDAEGIVMIANNYPQFPGGKEREEMHKLLSKRDDYVCYGSGYEGSLGNIPYRDTPDIYNKFRFAVGCNIYNDVDKYFSNRPLIAMAAGCCYLDKRIPGNKKSFHKKVMTYSNENTLLNYLDWHDKREPLRIAKKGQKLVRKKFHYDNIVKMWENEL